MQPRLSVRAERELLELHEYGALTFGVRQADLYVEELRRTLEMLALFPRIGREIGGGFRVRPYRSHVLLYSITAGGDVVVDRIVHGSSDWQAHLL